MAILPQKILSKRAQRQHSSSLVIRSCFVLMCAVLVCVAGCVNTAPWIAKRESTPGGAPTQVVVTWEPRVIVTADTVNGGAPLPGLAGRLYLFSLDCGAPVVHDGCLHAELYDMAAVAKGGQPVMLETWDIDAERMKLLLRKDIIGWGYTVFLPWSTYKPCINNVQLKVCYTTKSGVPLYAPTSPMRLLDSNCPPPRVTESIITPGAPAADSVKLLPPSKS